MQQFHCTALEIFLTWDIWKTSTLCLLLQLPGRCKAVLSDRKASHPHGRQVLSSPYRNETTWKLILCSLINLYFIDGCERSSTQPLRYTGWELCFCAPLISHVDLDRVVCKCSTLCHMTGERPATQQPQRSRFIMRKVSGLFFLYRHPNHLHF